jgi:hypothetical protein
VAGIIKPFKDIQEIGGIEDMNDMPEGIRYIYASPYQQIANRPEDSYGHLLTYMDAEGRTTQIYYAAERRVYMRSNLGGWNAWQRIDNFGYNSLAELSAGVAGQMGIDSTWLCAKNWESQDADHINVSGYYLNMNTMTNVPSDYGTLISFVPSSAHFVQFYSVASDTPRLYYRTKTSNVWSNWGQLSLQV